LQAISGYALTNSEQENPFPNHFQLEAKITDDVSSANSSLTEAEIEDFIASYDDLLYGFDVTTFIFQGPQK
jgi:hypothetical protein